MLIIDNEFINSNLRKIINNFADELDKEKIIDNKNYFIDKSIEDLIFILNNSLKINNLSELEQLSNQYFSSILENIKALNNIYCQFESAKKISSIISVKDSSKLITFTDNEKIILNIYSDIEDVYNIVLKWLNDKSEKGSHLYIPKVIKNKEYTFREFIKYEPCSSKLQEKNFYLNSGKLLALLYILNINNIKQEHIVAKGENPIILNFDNISDIKPINSFFCDEIANAIISNSVYNIEFLANNRPKLNDEYIECIKSGFQLVYNIVLENKIHLINLINDSMTHNQYLVSNVICRIQMLNIQDMKRQLSFINARFSKKHHYKNNIYFSSNELNVDLNSKNLLTVACNIGDYIIQKGIIGYKDSNIERTWIDTLENGVVSIIGNNLYEGNNGIALFLAYLGVVSDKDYFVNSALEAMIPVTRYVANINKNTEFSLSGFKGVSGIFYTLSKLYKLTGKENIKDFIKNNISILYKLIDDKCINVIDGSAGVIPILICIYNDIDDKELKTIITKLLNIAYTNVVEQIKLLENNRVFNLGFAYGLSGVIAYLSKLISIKKEQNIESVIGYILNIERKLYKKGENNLKNNWLNGCAGILLSRLMLKDAGYNDDLLDTEIDNLIEITIEKGLGDNPYYAYGQIGTLEILNYAAKISKNETLKNRCISTYNLIIQKALNGTMCDYDNEPISFINGLAGIGYSLIQKYDEDLVPQILFFS